MVMGLIAIALPQVSVVALRFRGCDLFVIAICLLATTKEQLAILRLRFRLQSLGLCDCDLLPLFDSLDCDLLAILCDFAS